MMTIEIIKNAPIPKQKSGRNKYPWAEMKLGDSFVADVRQTSILTASKSWKASNRPDWEFRTTKLQEHPPKTQIWRVK